MAAGWRALLGLGVFLLLTLGTGALGSIATETGPGSWYSTLEQPAFSPPDWVFGPVWTTLYVLIGVAGWRVWRSADPGRGRALLLWGVQLVLNLAWSWIFFGAQAIVPALVEIVVLWVVIVLTMLAFFRIDRLAGWLFVPYLLWVTFAAALNAGYAVLN
jgi:translocator protein